MMKQFIHCMELFILTVLLSLSIAQAQTAGSQIRSASGQAAKPSGLSSSGFMAQARRDPRSSFRLLLTNRARHLSVPASAASTTNMSVVGSGTVGHLTKWTDLTGKRAVIGDSSIFEDNAGNVGIGTETPTSKLTIAGMVQNTLDGLQFPDGTVQTSSAAGALSSVTHDATLTGNGTATSPLGIAVPLTLTGSALSILAVQNTVASGDGVRATGGDSAKVFVRGGTGVVARGGNFTSSLTVESPADGGDGVDAFGGNSTSGFGGEGVFALGGVSPMGFGLAGDFRGSVVITGNLNVTGAKNFKIDHPLDPENKYLLHAAIESSEVLNLYSGNVTTDGNGEAVVTLPDWFEAVNRDFRYQLTVIGPFAQAIVAEEIKDNRFTIKTNAPNVKVSWQVTGVRSDATMRKHPFKVEEGKTEQERGFYLDPEAHGQPEEKGIEWARHPKMMQQMKQRRLEFEQKLKQKQQ